MCLLLSRGGCDHLIRLVQEGCEYLIARTAEGKLDLRDVYVHDKDLDIFARPEVHGELPEQPLYYQEVPWTVMYTGDRINNKLPWKRVSMPCLQAFLKLQNCPQDAAKAYCLKFSASCLGGGYRPLLQSPPGVCIICMRLRDTGMLAAGLPQPAPP